jgi:hypothetical protein
MFGDETFAVKVERVDDLLDDDGRIIAERVMDVKLNFDINDDELLVNGVPVDLGLSTIQVETDILVAPRGQAAGITSDDVEPAFDTGIVKLKVKAQADEILIDAIDLEESDVDTDVSVDNTDQPDKILADASDLEESDVNTDVPTDSTDSLMVVRRVVVTARILEINGHDVVQTDLIEQVLDILPTGEIRHGEPKAIPMLAIGMPDAFDVELMAEQEQNMSPCHRGGHPLAQHAVHAWHRLPMAVRIGLATFFGSLLVLTLFVALPFAMYAQWRARRDPAYRALEPNDDDTSFDYGYDEKKAGDLKDPQIMSAGVVSPPAYEETDVLVHSTEETERQA